MTIEEAVDNARRTALGGHLLVAMEMIARDLGIKAKKWEIRGWCEDFKRQHMGIIERDDKGRSVRVKKPTYPEIEETLKAFAEQSVKFFGRKPYGAAAA